MKTSSKDAVRALLGFGVDPAAGLAPAFHGLGQGRARAAGIALCLAFAIAAALGLTLGARRFLGFWAVLAGFGGAGTFFKAFIAFLVPPVALTALGLAVRKLLGAPGSGPAGDIFTAGAALAPIGLATLLGGLLGFGNLEIAGLLFFFAFSYLVLLLYAGLTGLGGLSSRAAAPAVPVMIIVAGWLSKVLFVALF